MAKEQKEELLCEMNESMTQLVNLPKSSYRRNDSEVATACDFLKFLCGCHFDSTIITDYSPSRLEILVGLMGWRCWDQISTLVGTVLFDSLFFLRSTYPENCYNLSNSNTK